MDALRKQAERLRTQIDEALEKIGFKKLVAEAEALSMRSAEPDFWVDTKQAGEQSKRLADISAQLEPWQRLTQSVDDLLELINLGDESLAADITTQLDGAQKSYEELKKELRYSSPYDRHHVILGIYAGAGGTDAQDWAAMLLRMYVRWAERSNMKVSTIDESAGEEAGIKSVTIEISGPMAYGKLKHEHGVHRLVRLSPFNANSLRQTSFAKVEVMPKIDRSEEVEIDDKELKIDVYRSGGKGGQSVNTTDSAVRVTHLPTGIAVAIQNERSQLQNKETAMTILRSRLIQLQMEQHLEKLADLKGVNQSAEWGSQIRSYVLHPYKMVKDLRSHVESSDPEAVLDGDIDVFLESF